MQVGTWIQRHLDPGPWALPRKPPRSPFLRQLDIGSQGANHTSALVSPRPRSTAGLEEEVSSPLDGWMLHDKK